MKINIDRDFPVTVPLNYVTASHDKRALICARTRAGKTTLLCHLASKLLLEEEDREDYVCFIIGPNLTSFCEDVLDKFDDIPELNKYKDFLQILSVRNKRSMETISAMFAGVIPEKPILTVANADHTYVSKILKLIEAANHTQPNRKIVVFLDEAHKAGRKTYDPLKTKLSQLPNVSLIETTATFRARLLAIPPAEVYTLQPRTNTYVDPTSAEPIYIDREINNECMSMTSPHLSHEYLHEITEEWKKPASLVLVNGNQTINFHTTAGQQVLDLAKRTNQRIALITINGGSSRCQPSDDDFSFTVCNEGKTGKPIRSASSIIQAVHNLGYDHIVVIGQKQVEMGQTIGCPGFPLTLQILMVRRSKPKADNIAQWIRTGGNGVGKQRIMCPKEIWKDYKAWTNDNDRLSTMFQGLSAELQQLAAQNAYTELEATIPDYGDHYVAGVIPGDVSNIPTITHYWEISDYPKKFREQFKYKEGVTRKTLPARKWILDWIKQTDWFLSLDDPDSQQLNIRTIAGNINTDKKGRGGNDVVVYINADPEASSNQSWQRNVTAWVRHTDNKLCIRVRPNLEPTKGAVHDYYGNLRYPKSTNKTVLVLR